MHYAPIYYYNQYAPHRVLRRYLSRLIYKWADNKYGEKARGDVRGWKTFHHPSIGTVGVADFTEEQEYKLQQWHKWMKIKNKIGNPL